MVRRGALAMVAALAVLLGVGTPAQASPAPSPARATAPVGQRGPHLMRIPAKFVGPKALVRPATAPPGAQLTYYGGKVISNVQIVQVIWTNGTVGTGNGQFASFVRNTASPSVATFYQSETNSAYVDWLDSEYNTLGGTNQHIGRGSFASQYVITPSNSSTSLSDAQIQVELSAQIAGGHLPKPTADGAGNSNTYYAIFFPHGDVITQGGVFSCAAGGFYAYHGTIAASGSVGEIYYGVHPDMQTGSGATPGCQALHSRTRPRSPRTNWSRRSLIPRSDSQLSMPRRCHGTTGPTARSATSATANQVA